jgi:hypothetical protein
VADRVVQADRVSWCRVRQTSQCGLTPRPFACFGFRVGPQTLAKQIVVLLKLAIFLVVPIIGIMRAMDRRRLRKRSTWELVAAAIWTVTGLVENVRRGTNLFFLTLFGLAACWLWLCIDGHRRARRAALSTTPSP